MLILLAQRKHCIISKQEMRATEMNLLAEKKEAKLELMSAKLLATSL